MDNINSIKMKLLKIISLSLVFLVGTTVGCKEDFLEILPTGSLDETQLSSEAGLEGLLIGSYSMLLGRAGAFYNSSSNWFWGSVLGAEANKGTNAGDQAQVNEIQSFEPQTTNGTVFEKYSFTYEGIARANATLKVLASAQESVSEETKTRIEAEAKFLRAHYYFELKRLYNNTPFIDETWDGVELVPNNQDLWPFIESDFEFAFNNLPETQPEVGRANKWAAAAYQGKVFLYQQKFNEAKAKFDQVIANGVTTAGDKYALLDNYSDLFDPRNDNNAEIVFATQAAAGTGTTDNANPDNVLNFPYNGGPAGCCGFFQPTFDFANSYRTENGLPLLDGSYNDSGNELKDDMGVAAGAAFTPDDGPIDPRLDHAIGRRGIPYRDWGPHPGISWIRDQSYGGPYAPKKWVWSQADFEQFVDKSGWTPGYIALNIPIIRFADVLLMAAEAEVEAGSLEKAREYVNTVRERATNASDFVTTAGGTPAANYQISLYTTAWTDANVAREAVRMERKLELGMEGHRFFDLVRWGVAQEVINAYFSQMNQKLPASPFVGASFSAPTNEVMPIPQQEIDILGSDVLTQNPGY
jgi:hypothetical protein